jgi:serine/threonine-protein kinase
MLASSGEVKVADFGLARVEGDGLDLTQVGVTMGTPLYMSPEQIEGQKLDSRSDIYSLGVTVYHMLSGEPPFTGDSPLAVAVQHLNQPAKPLATRSGPNGPEVPPRFAQVVERMMAKKPAERFSDPLALLSELHVLAEEGARQGWAAKIDHSSLHAILQAADQRAAATSRLDELMKTTAMVRPRRLPARWVAAAVLGCALIGSLLALMMRPRWLLAGGEPAQIDNAGSVWKQLYQAKLTDTEAAWRAVADFYPDVDRYYHHLAKQGLVHHYFRVEEFQKAIRPLEELASLGNSQPSFQAFGIAGLVVAYVNLGDDERASDENRRLTADMRTLLEEQAPRMSQLLNEALDELTNRSL